VKLPWSKPSIVMLTLMGYVSSLFAAAIPLRSERWSIALSRVEGVEPSTQERASLILERRLARWLENLDSIQLTVQRGASPLSPKELEQESLRKTLDTSTTQLGDWVSDDKSQTGESAELAMKIERLAHGLSLDSGPTLQKAYWTLSARAWKMGDHVSAIRYLRTAVAFHPLGTMVEWAGWDSKFLESLSPGFQATVMRVSGEVRRNCEWELRVEPSHATLMVNGFDLKLGEKFSLPSGKKYWLEVKSVGFEPWSGLLSCYGPQRRELKIHLRPVDDALLARTISLNSPVRVANKSHCLIAPAKEEFKIFLYTPNVGLDEIPLTKPLLAAQLLSDPSGAALPIASDAFVSLFQRHQSSAGFPDQQSVGLDTESLASRVQGSVSKPGPRWYNDWKVWAVAGLVVGGGVAGYLLTRDHAIKATQGTLKVTFH